MEHRVCKVLAEALRVCKAVLDYKVIQEWEHKGTRVLGCKVLKVRKVLEAIVVHKEVREVVVKVIKG